MRRAERVWRRRRRRERQRAAPRPGLARAEPVAGTVARSEPIAESVTSTEPRSKPRADACSFPGTDPGARSLAGSHACAAAAA